MSEVTIGRLEGVSQQPLKVFTENAYLNYAMYVILDRALPHIADGLKPVQRRVLYAMSELGLGAVAKYKKSARTVGDVLGKFHPHGDGACYEAMVLMAQSFSYRYPLIDGQGNWGSQDDPKSFAAMRYTESRLTAYAESLLAELDQNTVDWVPNFDGTLVEPMRLPARLPNILLNGATGIAVGMATDIPPHNLREVASACVVLLHNRKATIDDLCKHIIAPDFPTNAEIITPKSDIRALYETGIGSLRMRAVYSEEEGDIVITALPFQVSGAKVLLQIAELMQAKKLPLVADLRDESDQKNPTRLVIVPRSNRVDIDAVMTHLFATTDLECTYRVNFNMIGLDGKPQVKSLLNILSEWLEFRISVVKRRLQNRLQKILDRLHILEGLLIAFLNIDEVIKIIRHEDNPKPSLIRAFKLTETQADAILDLKLRHLAKLEEQKIKGESQALGKEREWLASTLSSEQRLKKLIEEEILSDAKIYGDDRQSPLVVRGQAVALKIVDILPAEDLTVVLSQKGWVRSAKGHEIDPQSLSYKPGDAYLSSARGKSTQSAIFMDSTGRSYAIPARDLPGARGLGEAIATHVTPPAGAFFTGVVMGDDEQLVLIASNAGYGFITTLAHLHTRNSGGKAVLKCPEGAHALTPLLIDNLSQANLAAVSNEGRLLVFSLADLPQLPKGKGNKIISIPPKRVQNSEEIVVGLAILYPDSHLVLHSGKRHLSIAAKDLGHYSGARGSRGRKLPRGYQRVERVS